MNKRKHVILTAFLVIGLIVTLTACGQRKSASSKHQVMTAAVSNEISTLDSSKYGDTTSSEILQNTMEGLYRFNHKNQARLADAEQVHRSTNQKVYTFQLRRKARWSNGDPVTAQDYVTAWRRTVDPKNSSLDSDSFAIIKNGSKITAGKAKPTSLGVKALSKYRLQVQLANPLPYLPEILEGAQFYPQDTKVVQRLGSKYGTSSHNLVYNGPFISQGWTGSNLKWTLKKNPRYWDKKMIHLTAVKMQVVQTPQTGVNLFRSNSLDFMPLTADFVKEYQHQKDYHEQVMPMNGYLTYNLRRKVTGNVHVRQAISQAINKQELVKTILHAGKISNGIVASNFITDSTTGHDYRRDAGSMLSYNVQTAKRQWRIAQNELGRKKITLELLTSDMDQSKQVGEFIQSALMHNLPGLTIKLRSIPLKERLANTTDHNYDFVFGTWQPSYKDPLDFLTVGGLFNLEKDYHNQNFWHQIKLARSTDAMRPKQRLTALIKAERQLIQKDAFATPLYQAGTSYLLKPQVKGFQLSPYGDVAYYWNVRLN